MREQKVESKSRAQSGEQVKQVKSRRRAGDDSGWGGGNRIKAWALMLGTQLVAAVTGCQASTQGAHL